MLAMQIILLVLLAGLAMTVVLGACQTVPKRSSQNNATDSTPWRAYVGGYTGPESKGIQLLQMDRKSGALTEVKLVAELTNPTFLALHPNGKFLYAISEVNKESRIYGYAIDTKTGALTLLNQQVTGGNGPCHISLSADGRYAFTANYGSGSICVVPIGTDGRLQPPSAFVQHQGASADPQRQSQPHAHGLYVDPSGRYVLAVDLGLDQVLVYRFDATRGTLCPADTPFAKVAPGAGPRHLAFHPDGKYVYVINELNNTMNVLAWDSTRGELTAIQTLPTLPADFRGTSATAEVEVSPSGEFVYGSNRGHDSLAVYRINSETGKLTPTGFYSTRGQHPRHFKLDPTGQFLLIANRDTNQLVNFRVDQATGAMTPTGHEVPVYQPSCVVFYDPAKQQDK